MRGKGGTRRRKPCGGDSSMDPFFRGSRATCGAPYHFYLETGNRAARLAARVLSPEASGADRRTMRATNSIPHRVSNRSSTRRSCSSAGGFLTAAALIPSLLLVACSPGAKPAAEDPVARGKYLVENVAACGTCHTPQLPGGELDPKRPLAGNDVGFQGRWGTSFAPNLTPDRETGVGGLTDQE